MSAETCGGRVPMVWEFTENGEVTDRFFLRDDQDAGLCSNVRWSLFRDFPKEHYCRLWVFSGVSQSAAARRSKSIIATLLD